MNALTVFILGLVGALAPEVIRLYSLRYNPALFKWSWFYLIVSLLFCGLGGLVALILPATTPWGAFYAGISAPTLVTAAVKKGLSAAKKEFKRFTPPATPLPFFRSFIEGLF